eukprot:5922564-Alexandrium_andersonii.AAC.1
MTPAEGGGVGSDAPKAAWGPKASGSAPAEGGSVRPPAPTVPKPSSDTPERKQPPPPPPSTESM